MLKGSETANPAVTIRNLDIRDIEHVHSLFEREFPTLDYGFMAWRSIDEFAEILRDNESGVAVGAYQDGDLIGYSLGQSGHRAGMEQIPFLSEIRPDSMKAWPKVWSAKGTVVDRRHRGNRLMARLQVARSDAARGKGTGHWFGLVAEGNMSSLAGILRARFWIVGFEEDQYCRNFLCYEGPLNKNRQTTDAQMLDCGDVDGLAGAFASGWVGTALHTDGPTGRSCIELKRPAAWDGK